MSGKPSEPATAPAPLNEPAKVVPKMGSGPHLCIVWPPLVGTSKAKSCRTSCELQVSPLWIAVVLEKNNGIPVPAGHTSV
jgi:hypothetical protein